MSMPDSLVASPVIIGIAAVIGFASPNTWFWTWVVMVIALVGAILGTHGIYYHQRRGG